MLLQCGFRVHFTTNQQRYFSYNNTLTSLNKTVLSKKLFNQEPSSVFN